MDKATATVVVLGILALVFVSFFAVFRKSGKGKIKGPFGTGLEVEGSNESPQTRIKEVEAGGNIHINETDGRGIDAYKLKAGGHVTIGNLATTKLETAEPVKERTGMHIFTLEEIKDRIKAAPPFQQDDVRQHYVGLTIDWQTKLDSVEKADGDNLKVYLSVYDKDGRYVGLCTCNVPLIKYPELKVLHRNHPVRVVGRIAEIRDSDVARLDEPTLFFLPHQTK